MRAPLNPRDQIRSPITAQHKVRARTVPSSRYRTGHGTADHLYPPVLPLARSFEVDATASPFWRRSLGLESGLGNLVNIKTLHRREAQRWRTCSRGEWWRWPNPDHPPAVGITPGDDFHRGVVERTIFQLRYGNFSRDAKWN